MWKRKLLACEKLRAADSQAAPSWTRPVISMTWATAWRPQASRGTGILVKAPKPTQDHRFDLPSIGPQTVEHASRAGLAGIAVLAGSTIVAEAEQLVAAADNANIFVVGVRSGPER